jgi:hypothetical protein
VHAEVNFASKRHSAAVSSALPHNCHSRDHEAMSKCVAGHLAVVALGIQRCNVDSDFRTPSPDERRCPAPLRIVEIFWRSAGSLILCWLRQAGEFSAHLPIRGQDSRSRCPDVMEVVAFKLTAGHWKVLIQCTGESDASRKQLRNWSAARPVDTRVGTDFLRDRNCA